MLNPLRRLLILIVIACALTFMLVHPSLAAGGSVEGWRTGGLEETFQPSSLPTLPPPSLQPSNLITATKTYTLATDSDGDQEADPGDVLSYTIVITNNGVTTNTGVIFSDTLDPNLSQLGLASVSPVAFDDGYNAHASPIILIAPDGPADLFANDYPGLNPAVIGISSFGGGSLGGAVTSNAAGSTVAAANGAVTVNANGSLVFTPSVGFQGVFSFSYRLQNFVGPADGLVQISVDAPPTVTTTSPANNATDVNGASNITINFSENVNIAAGGIILDCGSGAVNFTSTPALPVSGTNTISLDPAANMPGLATCTVTILAVNVTDSDASDPPDQLDGNNDGLEGGNYSFSFQVAPTANDDSFNVTPHLTLASTGSVRDNDDPTTVTITGFGPTLATANGTVPNGTNFITAGGAGGRVVLNADGTFTYFPDAGDTNTTATFFYTITGNDTAQVTLTLQNTELVWFVDDNAAGTLCTGSNAGAQACPLATLTGAAAVDTASDTLFVVQGSYTCGVTLETSERLLGDGSASDLQTITGITPVSGSSFPAFSGTDPTLSSGNANCLTLAASNTIQGLTINANSANVGDAAIFGSGVGGTTTVNDVTINTSSSGNGVILNNQGGTFTFSNGSITGSNAAGAVGVNQGTGTINFTNATINKTGGGLIAVTNKTGGSVSFTGGSITGTTLNPVVLAGVILLQNNTGGTTSSFSNGFNITTSSGGGFFASSGGAVTIGGTSSTISASGGPALDVTGTTFSGGATFATVTSSNSSSTGVSLVNVTGNLTMNGGSISGSAGTAFNVSGGASNITYAGSVAKTSAGRVVDIQSHSGGSISLSGNLTCTTPCTGLNASGNSGGTAITFSGGTKTLNTGTSAAVTLSSNTGATINFTGGGLDIDTTSGVGFNATGGGTVNVTGSNNTINSTIGTALNVANTTIGASGLTFRSISSDGGSNTGIILDTTGSGGLTVTGTGSAGSGGTIANKTGANGSTATGIGIYLNSTGPVSLSRMQMNDFQNFAILGNTVASFILRDSVINGLSGTLGAGNAGTNPTSRESVIFITDLSGISGILNSTISGGATDNIRFIKNSGTLNLTITGNTIQNNDNTNGGIGEDGIFISTAGSSSLLANISNNTLANHHGDHISASGNGTSQLHVTINNNGMTADGGVTEDFDNNGIFGDDLGGTILVADNDSADVFFDVSNNTMFGAVVTAIAINQSPFSTAAASLSGRVQNNTIGDAAITDSGSAQGSGIAVDAQGLSAGAGLYKIIMSVADNDVFEYNNHGLLLASGDGSSALAATVTGNIINNPGTFGANGIHLNHGKTSTPAAGGGPDSQTGCFDIRTNNIVGAGSVPNGATDFRLRQRFNTTVQLVGYTGGTSDTAAVVAYIQGLNTGTETGQAVVSGTGGGFTNTPSGANCPSPTLPTLPPAP